MMIGIQELDDSSGYHKSYIVDFYNDSIQTTVTHDSDIANDWICEIERIHRWRLNYLTVGLDIEWRPNNRFYQNPVATLQLCVGRRCLIFQLIHADEIPISLIEFLADERYTFVGVGIDADLQKLDQDYRFGGGANSVDLRDLAAERYERDDLRNWSLKRLSSFVMDKEMVKPHRVTMSRWDYHCLTEDQVKYACVDAFVSFEIGKSLNASAFASSRSYRSPSSSYYASSPSPASSSGSDYYYRG